MNYNVLGAKAPTMPKLGKGLEFVKIISSKTSLDMRQSIVPTIFPALAAHLSEVVFQYADNSWKQLCGMMCHLVGPQSVGKKQMDQCIEAINRDFHEHDEIELKKLCEWKRENQKKIKGRKDGKPQQPEICLRYPPSDVTNPAFILNAMACETAGNVVQYYKLQEIEMADNMCGGHKKVSQLIRNVFDTERGGSLRATADGVTGNPVLRTCMNFASTSVAARSFYKYELYNGTLSRIFFSYKARKERNGKIPRIGETDEAYLSQIDEYIERLTSCKGRFKVTQLNKLADKLAEDMAELADLTDDDTLWDMSKRSIVNAWKCGCILWILNDQVWTRSIGDMVEWLVYHDLWSKLQIFGDMLKSGDTSTSKASKSGPKNMLDSLGENFSETDLEELRAQQGMEKDAKNLLRVWGSRGYVTYSAQTGLYTKTEKYIKKASK